MQALRALLVDDEVLAIRRLSRSLEKVDGVEVVGTTTSSREAVELIGSEKPDMVFLDISMPGLTGFDVLDRLPPEASPAIIFVTAYDRHAVHAFDVSAADYLMKPFAQARLEEAVDRGRLWLQARTPAPRWLDSLWVHRHREFARVGAAEIDWIEAHGDYVRVHGPAASGLARNTLSALETRLDPERFVRTHRSAICRKAAIVSMKRRATGAVTVQLANGDEAPVGRRFIPGLRALLKAMAG